MASWLFHLDREDYNRFPQTRGDRQRSIPDMPSPGAPVPLRLPIEDSYFELLADTLEGIYYPARGHFLQRYLRAIAHIDLPETPTFKIIHTLLSPRPHRTLHPHP